MVHSQTRAGYYLSHPSHPIHFELYRISIPTSLGVADLRVQRPAFIVVHIAPHSSVAVDFIKPSYGLHTQAAVASQKHNTTERGGADPPVIPPLVWSVA